MACEICPIAIADDGDLDDVRRLLRRLRLDFEEGALDSLPSEGLRISNARHALDSIEASRDAGRGSAFHIVVVDEDSSEDRHALRDGGFDFVVQRPVHPAALRLLILHALYGGPERRTRSRVAMDAEVKLGGSLRRRGARLTQLSEKGCGLVAYRELSLGESVSVVLPARLTGSAALRLDGRVVSVEVPKSGDPSDGIEVSLAFRPPNGSVRKQLRDVMAGHGIGSAALHPQRRSAALSEEEPEDAVAPAAEDESQERRRAPRKLYRRPVLASAKGGVHTLVGRDLSTGGMRVSFDARLEVGDEFKLVIYGAASRTPLLVKAVVSRDDGERGHVLLFRDVAPSAAAWLEDAVDALPRFASNVSGPSLVVSEIIEDA